MENNNEWIIALYHYLDSILPPGGADEAFRVAPEAIREEIAALETKPGYVAGISARHTPQAGCVEVAPAPTKTPNEEMIADIKEMVRLSDLVGYSRQVNRYAMNKAAVDRLIELEMKVYAQLATPAPTAPSDAEAALELAHRWQKRALEAEAKIARMSTCDADAAPAPTAPSDASDDWKEAYGEWCKKPLPPEHNLADIPAAMWAAFHGGWQAAKDRK